ncbi:hypothetical protein KUCAC02_011615, partial [Chaenocephalus aceratus]
RKEDLDDDDVIIDPNYNPSSDESSVPENEDSLAAASEHYGPHLEDYHSEASVDSQAAPLSHYSSPHRPDHESSSGVRTEMERGYTATAV